jgi:hypothetical protein
MPDLQAARYWRLEAELGQQRAKDARKKSGVEKEP